MKKVKGFTLVEMLVVMAVLSITGVLILNIFTRTLRGSNKTQVIQTLKQNGQSALDLMDKTIRNSDLVICPATSSNTLVVVKDGNFQRLRFIPPNNTNPGVGNCNSRNGCIAQDFPVQPAPPATESDLKVFLNNVCTNPLETPQIITDTNERAGISIQNGIFTRNKGAGFNDIITISFEVAGGHGISSALSGQIDPVSFQTTVDIR